MKPASSKEKRWRYAHSSRYAEFRILVPGWDRPRIGQFACFVQGPFASALAFVQLSCLPCAKSLPDRGEAFVPPGNDLNAYFIVNPSGVYRAQRDALWKSIR